MGQRSQIYVRFNSDDNGKKGLIANYYTWNYGERMISRAKWGINFIKERLKYPWFYQRHSSIIQLSRIFDTNFDMKDIQLSHDIISEYKEFYSEDDLSYYFNDFVFEMQDNNDGKLLVDIDNDVIKYAFLDCDANPNNVMDAEDYMVWNSGDDTSWTESECLSKQTVCICKENIKYISENAKLMSEDEVKEFINYNYVSDLQPF